MLRLCCVGGQGSVFVGGVNEKWYLRYVVGPRSIQMNTVMRSVLSACHEKRAQWAHRL